MYIKRHIPDKTKIADSAGSTVNPATNEKIDEVITALANVEIKNDVGNPVPVSASSLPLPAGAATEATLQAVQTAVNSAKGVTGAAVPSGALLAGVEDGSGNLQSLKQPTTPADVQPVSATALPLPTGAASETTLGAVKAKADNLDLALTALRDAIVGAGASATTHKQLLDKLEEARALLADTLTVAVSNLPADPATGAGQTTGNASLATLATRADIATSALRDAITGAGVDATTNKHLLDKLEALRLLVDTVETLLATLTAEDYAQEATLQSVLAQLDQASPAGDYRVLTVDLNVARAVLTAVVGASLTIRAVKVFRNDAMDDQVEIAIGTNDANHTIKLSGLVRPDSDWILGNTRIVGDVYVKNAALGAGKTLVLILEVDS